jgi:hypothetical protein
MIKAEILLGNSSRKIIFSSSGGGIMQKRQCWVQEKFKEGNGKKNNCKRF